MPSHGPSARTAFNFRPEKPGYPAARHSAKTKVQRDNQGGIVLSRYTKARSTPPTPACSRTLRKVWRMAWRACLDAPGASVRRRVVLGIEGVKGVLWRVRKAYRPLRTRKSGIVRDETRSEWTSDVRLCRCMMLGMSSSMRSVNCLSIPRNSAVTSTCDRATEQSCLP